MNERLITRDFPFIPVSVTLANASLGVQAYLDTGFSGALSIPLEALPTGTEFDGESVWALADGTEIVVPFVVARLTIQTLGLRLHAPLSVVGSIPTVGRLLTDRLKLTLDHGRELIIEP